MTIEQIRTIATALPGVEERPSHGGRPSWRTPSPMFAWVRENPEALVVWVESIEAKEGLIAAAPDRYFTTEHYDAHAMALVNLEAIDVEEVREAIFESWRLRAPKRVVARFDEA